MLETEEVLDEAVIVCMYVERNIKVTKQQNQTFYAHGDKVFD